MFGFLPNNLFTGHRDANTTGLSPRIWGRLYGSLMASGGGQRLVLIGDDFLAPRNASSYTILYSEAGYKCYIDTSCTIIGEADEKCGAVYLYHDNTDNNEVWIQSGDGASVLGAISDTASDAHLTCFECRFKVNSVVDDVNAMFVGLAEEGCPANSMKVDNTGVMADKDYIGFNTVHTNGGTTGTNAALNFVYKKAGATAQTKIAAIQTLVADTWYKAGFVYDPFAMEAKRIAVYLDNVENTTYVTATNIAATTFPDAEELAFLAGVKAGTSTAGGLLVDWWSFGQLIV